MEPGEGAASGDAPRDVERRSETVQPGTPPEVSLLRSDEMRRVRRRVRHVLARPPGVLRRAVARHVHQSPDHQPPGGGRTRARGTARQADAPGPVRGLLPRVRARVESAADGASREPVERSHASSPVVEREIRKLIQAIKDGVSALSIKDELLSLEARKAELQSRLEAPEMPELLHPRMADVYREKVGSLCLALESEESRTGAGTPFER